MKFTKPGKTVQHLKSYCDINNIISRSSLGQSIPTVEVSYGKVNCSSLLEAHDLITKAEKSFNSLPSDIRSIFKNNPVDFYNFVSNPDNTQALYDLGLAVKPVNVPQVTLESINSKLDSLQPVSKTVDDSVNSD